VEAWTDDPDRLQGDLYDEDPTSATGLSLDLLGALRGFGADRSIVKLSSASGDGLEDLYSAIQMVYAGGEDLERR